MSQHWNRDADVIAWTDHDGPGRPSASPSPRWFAGLAIGWTAWFAVALVGCAVFHHAGADHLDTPVWNDVLGAVTVLLVPLAIGLLARERALGAWLSAGLGIAACTYSASNVAVLPWWTVIEAGGFAVLGVLGAWLAVSLRLAARRTQPLPVLVAPAAPTVDVAVTGSAVAHDEDQQPVPSVR